MIYSRPPGDEAAEHRVGRFPPTWSKLQRSVLETKRKIIAFSLLPSEKLDFGILTQTVEFKPTQGSGSML